MADDAISKPFPTPKRWRFGQFEVDLSTGELRKNGLRVRIQEQPLRILGALLERPGEVVIREDLKERLWPADTFVDFERSLNAAVGKLRQVMADSAEQPRYIETVARRGYRFIAPVEASPELKSASDSIDRAADSPVSKGQRVSLPWLAGAVALLLLALTGGLFLRRPPAETGVVRFVLSPPEGTRFAGPYRRKVLGLAADNPTGLSPDGLSLVFAAIDSSGNSALWVRPLASEVPRRIENTDGAIYPFWSPDSRNIAFFATGKLKTVSPYGGSVHTLCDANLPDGGTWNQDNVILFSAAKELYPRELYRVSASGGQVSQVTHADKALGEAFHAWPQFLPDGRHFLFWVAAFRAGLYYPRQSAVFVGSLDSAERHLLFANRSRAVFSPPNYVLFMRDSVLMAQRMNLRSLRMEGEPAVVAEDTNTPRGDLTFSVSDTGVLAYRVGPGYPLSQLVWYGREGQRSGVVAVPGEYVQLAISPDEKFVALIATVDKEVSHMNLWLLQLETGVLSHLTFGERDADPVWSPDSRTILYGTYHDDGHRVDLMQLTVGERSPRLFYTDGKSNKPEAWSPDGRFIIYRRDELMALSIPADGKGKPVVLLDTPIVKARFSFSPDGRWLAYVSQELTATPLAPVPGGRIGRPQIYVSSFPAMSETRQISTTFGCLPLWRKDGKELFFAGDSNVVMAASVSTGSSLQIGPPKMLFQPAAGDANYCLGQYGVTAQGQRFLTIETPPAPVAEDRIHIVTHWDAALRR